MKIAELVKYRIDRFAEGYVFTYADFNVDAEKESALKIALYRLVKSGKIERLSKGRFYKPKPGIITNLKPNEYEMVKDLLMVGNKIIGYITGYSVFNSLKLTTQVPNVIQIAVNFDKKGIKRGIYIVKFVRQWNKITKANIPLLQLLDCIRFIKSIPDATIANSINRISILLKELSESEKKQIVDLAINYPPSTRALVGAIFEQSGYADFADKLLKTLKATTWYSFNIPESLLPNKLKWKIK
jgi:predicted transcriptional regulator of viral defense system